VAANPHIRVIALSMHKDSVYVREILRAGARLPAQGFGRGRPGEGDPRGGGRESYLSPAVSNAVLDDYASTSPIRSTC